jgi:hypothetical protein
MFPKAVDMSTPDRIVGPDVETEIAFDLYFADKLGALIGQAFTNRLEWAPTELLSIRRRLEPRRQLYVALQRGPLAGDVGAPAQLMRLPGTELPSGLVFYGLMASQAIRNDSDRDASEAIDAFFWYLNRCLHELPQTNTATMLNVEGVDAKSGEGDEFIWALQMCLRRFEVWGEEASEHRLTRALRTMADELASTIRTAAHGPNDEWALFLINRFGDAAWALASIASASGIRAYRVPMLHVLSAAESGITAVVRQAVAQQVEMTMVRTPSVLHGLSTIEIGWLANALLPDCVEEAGRLLATYLFVLRDTGPKAAVEDAERAIDLRRNGLGAAREAFDDAFNERIARLEANSQAATPREAQNRPTPPKERQAESSSVPTKRKVRGPSSRRPHAAG